MILQTKIISPQLRELFVARPRLCAQLTGVLQRRLGLICAPAGYGKTSLLSEWLCSLPEQDAGNGGAQLHVAWLALDNGDDDLPRFLNGIIAAMRRQKPTIGRAATTMLAQELLNQLHPHVQQFLLRTPIVQRVCQPLYRALLQGGSRQGARRMQLQELVPIVG